MTPYSLNRRLVRLRAGPRPCWPVDVGAWRSQSLGHPDQLPVRHPKSHWLYRIAAD